MSQTLKKTVLLVDYENVQKVDLSLIQEQDIDIKIFVGQAQNKIPIDLVQATQQLGQRVEWVKIDGAGNNALDFHIAFYLGRFSSDAEGRFFLILSKDKGFDPLLKYVNKNNKIKCRRINSLVELSQEKTKAKETLISQDTDSITKIIHVLQRLLRIAVPKHAKACTSTLSPCFRRS
ncbi:PIN domain-containing protein [Leptolyngbya ohadii]|uniref:PIN domain-containing protein n=1 Tax=Leptolyngbya ohadii TaxID=1962290 RepID=UPI000B59F3DC|nr:PIN domain-containing protein [Leptolyngbya ohadii]